MVQNSAELRSAPFYLCTCVCVCVCVCVHACVCVYNRCASHVGVVLSAKVVPFPLADIGEGIFEAQVMKWWVDTYALWMKYSTAIVESLKHCEVVLYIRYRLRANMPSFRVAFSGKGLVCCTLTIQHSTYNTVGRSIASLCDFCGIFTSALCTLVYMLPCAMYFYLMQHEWLQLANNGLFTAESFAWHGEHLKQPQLADHSFIQHPQEHH